MIDSFPALTELLLIIKEVTLENWLLWILDTTNWFRGISVPASWVINTV